MKVAILFGIIMLGACSSQEAYHAIQENRRAECEKLPDRQREECLEDYQMSYEEYERARSGSTKQ